MTNSTSQHPKVFISYSWDSDEHKDNVLKLAARLRNDGIDCNIDQYEQFPPEGWPHWMRNQVDRSDFVLVVCSEQYKRRFQGKEEIGKGKGATWEGAIINQFIYDQVTNTKFIPVIFSPQQDSNIPNELRRFTYYLLNRENWDGDKGYENLYRYLTKQPLNKKPQLGKLRSLPPRQRETGFDSNRQTLVSATSKHEEAQQEKLTELYNRARRLHRARQWKKVIAVFQEMQEENLPYVDPDGFYKLARNELTKEQERRKRVQEEQERKKRELENLYDRGIRDFKDKKWQEAERKFEAILQQQPSDRNLQARAEEKLAQAQEKLAQEKWFSIAIIVIGWLMCIPFLQKGNQLAGGIGGLLSGGFIWWASQRTKQLEPSHQVLQLLGFCFTGVVIGVILCSIIEWLGLPYVATVLIGGAIAVGVLLWQTKK